MDERLEKALDFSNYRLTIETQKRNLKARLEALQTFMYNNGTWRADTNTIAFVHALIASGNTEAIIQDSRGNPVIVSDLSDFFTHLISTYNQSMNEFSIESGKLAKARNIKKIMDW